MKFIQSRSRKKERKYNSYSDKILQASLKNEESTY